MNARTRATLPSGSNALGASLKSENDEIVIRIDRLLVNWSRVYCGTLAPRVTTSSEILARKKEQQPPAPNPMAAEQINDLMTQLKNSSRRHHQRYFEILLSRYQFRQVAEQGARRLRMSVHTYRQQMAYAYRWLDAKLED